MSASWSLLLSMWEGRVSVRVAMASYQVECIDAVDGLESVAAFPLTFKWSCDTL